MPAFKAIIIGGGPSGLAMAHCLSLAGVDYVLCEQRESIVDREGAALSIMPHTARIFQQFGMLDQMKQWSTPMRSTVHVTGKDRGWRDNGPEIMHQKFGYDIMLFERHQLIRLMLEGLPDRHQRIRTGKKLQSITELEGGVSATFADGTVEHGSIIIGADGVHSKVRQLIHQMHPGDIDPHPFPALTRGLYGHGPRPGSLRNGEVVEKHYDGWSFQTLTGRDRTFYFIYENLPQPVVERRRFTKADAEGFVKPYMEEKILGDLTFGDLWKQHDVGNLRHLEQGVSRVWSRGRIVLVGDSAHKVTPNLGIGGNTGVESAVCLANHLHALLQKQLHPGITALEEVFAAYQQQRAPVVQYWYEMADNNMKFLTFATDSYKKTFKRRVSNRDIQTLSELVLPDQYLRTISQGLILDYVPLEMGLSGTYPWTKGANSVGKELRPKL